MIFSRSVPCLELQYDLLNFIEQFEEIHGFRGSGAIVWAAGALVRRKLVLNNVSDLCRVCGGAAGVFRVQKPPEIHLRAERPFFSDFSVTKKNTAML